MTTSRQLGEQIRQARQARRLTAVALAERAGIHRNTLLALETGRGNIELARLLAICDELQLELMLVPQAVADVRRADLEPGAAGTSTELAERVAALMGSGARP